MSVKTGLVKGRGERTDRGGYARDREEKEKVERRAGRP